MKSKKLGLFLFIVQFVLCLSLVVSASALESDDSIDISYSAEVQSSAVEAGETVTVKIFLDKNVGFIASKFYVTYDSEKLTFVDFDWTDSAFAGSVSATELPDGGLQVEIGDPGSIWNNNPPVYRGTGYVVGLVFVASNIGFDATTVTIETSTGNTIPPVITDIFNNPYNVQGDSLTLHGSLHQHIVGEWVIDVEPTCNAKGSKSLRCAVCLATMQTAEIDATSHTEGEWVVDTAATCTTVGAKHQVCAVCTETIKTEEIPVAAHTEGEWIEDKAASCTEEGAKHQVCAVCTETIKTETIEKKAHGTVVDAAVAPTCTATGLTEGSRCPDCTFVHVAQEVIPVIEHKYNDGVITTAPTAATEGVKTFTCTACPASYTEKLAKIAPTMVEAGDKWNKKMETVLVFRTDAAFADFTEVRVNGTVLAAENYTVSDATGIKVELKREYLESLEGGEYKVDVVSASGIASATFTIEKESGGCGSVMSTGVAVLIAVAACFAVKSKKKDD